MHVFVEGLDVDEPVDEPEVEIVPAQQSEVIRATLQEGGLCLLRGLSSAERRRVKPRRSSRDTSHSKSSPDPHGPRQHSTAEALPLPCVFPGRIVEVCQIAQEG